MKRMEGNPVLPDVPGPEGALLVKLRAGDEAAFTALVDGLNCRLQALAATFTSSPALAEDIVQETWLGVIRGLDGFEGRSSLRTWIFSILIRRARTLASREARRAGVAPANGAAPDREEWDLGRGRVGLWEAAPEPWTLDTPEQVVQGLEALEIVRAALDGLPEAQRQVVLLRDVEDVSPSEICNILDLTETNMRVLLHRGRARIRRALDLYLREGTRPSTAETPVQETR
ncbi:MAG TPA: RNA polymerase sigma factor [Candidatus Binatia bacterium]|nr:RNA polymerase sigma factor [Candidatus Binatia bacterium]